jgi:DNA-binding transcriptional LysR family regulator
MPPEPVVPTDALVDLVAAGLGVAVVSEWAIGPYLARRGVRKVDLAGAMRWDWSLATRKGAPQPAHVKGFLDVLARHLGRREPAAPS